MYNVSKGWADSPLGEAHKELIEHFRALRNQQVTRYDTFRRYMNIYEYGFTYGNAYLRGIRELDETTLSMNAAQNIIDTMHASIYASPVVPMAVTQGGDYSQRKRARMLNRALEGVYTECNVKKAESSAGLDALLCGCGIIKVWSEGGNVKVARVNPLNILVDDMEGENMLPRTIFQRATIDRAALIELYPDHEEAIKNAPPAKAEDYGWIDTNDAIVEVVEVWRKPSTEDAKDGRHALVIEGASLIDEAWTKQMFPFAVNRPKEARSGWWGLAIMRQLAAGQYEFEKVTHRLSMQHELFGTTQMLVNKGAKLSARQISNEVGRVLEWEGNIPPVELTPMPAHPQSYQYRAMIPQEMAQFVGTNEFAVQQKVPDGLKNASGKALQVFNDEGSKRYATYHAAREDCSLQIADLVIDTVKDLMKENRNLSVRFATRNGYEQIQWSDVLGAEEDQKSFILRIFPVSSLSQEPSAKFQQLDTLLNIGAIDVAQFKKLSGIPDLDSENEVESSDTDIIDWSLDHMVSEKEYIPPQPFDNLELAITRAGKFLNMCRKNMVEEDAIELIHNYILDAQTLLKIANGELNEDGTPVPPPPPPAPPIPGGVPGMPPMPAPGGPMPPMPAPMPPEGMPQ